LHDPCEQRRARAAVPNATSGRASSAAQAARIAKVSCAASALHDFAIVGSCTGHRVCTIVAAGMQSPDKTIKENTMKALALGFAAALALGAAAFAAPASAMTPVPVGMAVSHGISGISQVRYVKRTVVRRGPHCTMRKVIKRGPHGRRVVRTVRVCH
jgi:hypothetical protein